MLSPFAGFTVDLFAIQPEVRTPLVQVQQRVLRIVVVLRLAGQAAERPEFEEIRADLGRIGLRAAHGSGLEIDLHVREAGGGIEDGDQPVTQVAGQLQEALVAGELVVREQSPQQAGC